MVITLSFSLSKEGVSRVYLLKYGNGTKKMLFYWITWEKWTLANTILKGGHSDLISEENAKHHSVCRRPCANKSWPSSIRSTMSSLVKIYEHPNKILCTQGFYIWPWPLSLWPWGKGQGHIGKSCYQDISQVGWGIFTKLDMLTPGEEYMNWSDIQGHWIKGQGAIAENVIRAASHTGQRRHIQHRFYKCQGLFAISTDCLTI